MESLIALGAAVEDRTDLNYEVSHRYFVRRDGAFAIVELSLVGPYAVVWDGDGKVLEPITPGASAPDLMRDVLGVLEAHGLQVLDEAVLRTPVEMPFSNVEAGRGTLYQALIADTPSPLAEHSS